jgi:hypothetical protein
MTTMTDLGSFLMNSINSADPNSADPNSNSANSANSSSPDGTAPGLDLDQVGAELQRLHAERQLIDERINDLKQQVLAACPEGTVHRIGKERVFSVRRAGRRFDEVKAASVLPASVLSLISVMKPDGKIAKVKLPPETYQELLTDGSLTVVLR